MLKRLLKLFLIVLILAVLAGLDAWLVLWKHWPWWVGASLYAGVIGIWILIIFIKKYLTRKKERQFVHRVVELDEAAIKKSTPEKRQELKDLQKHWMDSVQLLRESNVKRGIGDPIYSLPWYVIIGESGAGKTSAIRNARLNSPVTDITRTAGLAATQNCDWWFLDNSIILDTAGRYTIPSDEAKDKEEWEEFLVLLSKYRRREPINGVIAAISAEKLLTADSMTLRAEGHSIRKRIDQLMRITGAKFPVYVLVTKADMVYGFTDSFNWLSDDDAGQAAGYLNSNKDDGWERVIDRCMAKMHKNLHEIRMRILIEGKNINDGVFVLQQEFAALKPSLADFIGAVFTENTFQETPVLRGIYFSSAQQDGTPKSAFLESVGIPEVDMRSGNKGRGIFLRDFFGTILPNDRYFMRPVYELIRWKRFTKSLGFVSVVLIFAALAGLLTFSFFNNLMILNKFKNEFKTLPVAEANPVNNILTMEKLRQKILEVQDANKRLLLPSFGLGNAKNFEKQLKEYYVSLFSKDFLYGFDNNVLRQANSIDETSNSDVIAASMDYLVHRIHIMNLYSKHGFIPKKKKDYDVIEEFTRATTNYMVFTNPQIPTPVANIVAPMYISYLDWSDDESSLERSLKLYHNAMDDIIWRHNDLKWIISQSTFRPYDIYLEDFWTKSGEKGKSGIFVSGVFTKKGEKTIEDFLMMLYDADINKKTGEENIEKFWEWYRVQHFSAWHDFIVNFNKGTSLVKSDNDKRSIAVLMSTEHNPYWTMLRRAAAEMATTKNLKSPPIWAQLVVELDEAQKVIEKTGESAKKDIKSKLAETQQKVAKRLELFKVKEIEDLDKRIAVGNALAELKKGVGNLAPIAVNDENAFRLVSDFFTEPVPNSENKSPFYAVYVEYKKVKSLLKDYDENSDFVWNAVVAPLKYLMDYSVSRSSCYLQALWERDVLSHTESVEKERVTRILFNKTDGLAWKFRDGPAKPFLSRTRWGYGPRKILTKTDYEQYIDFKPDLFAFLNRGESFSFEYKPEYQVRIQTIPIAVNEDASIKPTGVILSVQCVDNEGTIKNYNHFDKGIVKWAPDKCGDTVLKIQFPDMMLEKSYNGSLGFPRFLSDFHTGARTFKAEEFPEQQNALARNNVKWIRIRYKIEQGQPVINLLKDKIPNIPRYITGCKTDD